MIDQISLIAIFPEALLLAMACAVTLLDLRAQGPLRGFTYALTLLTLGVVALIEGFYASTGLTLYGFGNMVVADTMAAWLKCFATIAVMVTLVYGRP